MKKIRSGLISIIGPYGGIGFITILVGIIFLSKCLQPVTIWQMLIRISSIIIIVCGIGILIESKRVQWKSEKKKKHDDMPGV